MKNSQIRAQFLLITKIKEQNKIDPNIINLLPRNHLLKKIRTSISQSLVNSCTYIKPYFFLPLLRVVPKSNRFKSWHGHHFPFQIHPIKIIEKVGFTFIHPIHLTPHILTPHHLTPLPFHPAN